MDFGINLATSSDSYKVVKRAEELGFKHAWFYDTQMLNADVFVAMAASAMVTTKIRLGTGVLIPTNRIAPVAASALASMNALAPGRIDFGISTGYTGRRAMGLGPVKLADMKEYIRVVQALLRGETPEWDFEGKRRKIRFLNPEIGAINIKDEIPLHISAFGPKGRQLTAELGAHWIFAPANPQLGSAAVEGMRKAYREAGRNPEDFHVTAIAGGAVLRDGEAWDSPRMKAQAGPHATIVFHNLVEAEEFGDIGRPVPPHLKSLLERYTEIYRKYEPADARYLTNHRGHLMFLRPEEHEVCTGEMIRAMTFSATKAELVERLRAMDKAGYDTFAINIRHGHPEMLEDWAEVFATM